MNKYNSKGINFLSKKRWLEKVWENNRTIAPNVSYGKREKLCAVYVSKHSLNSEKEVTA